MNALERRLARLEAEQPRVPAIVAVAQRWLSGWDEMRPRYEATMADLLARRAAGESLSPIDARIVELTDEPRHAQGDPSCLADCLLQTITCISQTEMAA
jgi:hypothetical protein